MRIFTLFAVVLLAVLAGWTSCTNRSSQSAHPDTFVIDGQLPAGRYDSAILYLVPMYGPHPRPVDSVFIGHDGRFRFEGNVEQMAVLRLEMHRRYGIQDLLVCTEPGATHVILDSISSSAGTPQNELLQQWKDRQQQYMADYAQVRVLRGQGYADEAIRHYTDSVRTAMGEFNYQLLKGAGRQTVTVFINKMFSGTLDSLRRAELNEMLIDTIDYNLPQPGFRR